MQKAGAVKIVVLGGGFAGITTALELGRLTKRDDSIAVYLVNNENYFVFQPLLPEVVSCSIEPSHILNPIRQLCRHISFLCATVKGIDTETQRVILAETDTRKSQTMAYDHLVLCFGQVMGYANIPGMKEHSLPIKTLGDAFHLRNHIVSRLEDADVENDEVVRRKALTFVIIGGGFSGVETAAEINDMLKAVLLFYPRARATGHRMVLVHSGERILNELDEGLAEFARRKLETRGVEVMLNSRVNEVTRDTVVLNDGQSLAAGTVVCTVGNLPHPLATMGSLLQEQGRIVVDDCLRVRGIQNLWALGDAALVPDVRRGGFCPPTAQYAVREGKQCARNVLAAIRGRPPNPFRYVGLGQLAVVGKRCGVAQIGKWRISGFLAWCLWRAVYYVKLPGLRCKVRVGIDWGLDLLFPRDITKVEVQRTGMLQRAHFLQGEVIIRQGEQADCFYLIESGQVEVIREESGKPVEVLRICCAGDSFGEIALLKNEPRTATVRCLTPVNVLRFGRHEFLALVGNYSVFRSQIEKTVEQYIS